MSNHERCKMHLVKLCALSNYAISAFPGLLAWMVIVQMRMKSVSEMEQIGQLQATSERLFTWWIFVLSFAPCFFTGVEHFFLILFFFCSFSLFFFSLSLSSPFGSLFPSFSLFLLLSHEPQSPEVLANDQKEREAYPVV